MRHLKTYEAASTDDKFYGHPRYGKQRVMDGQILYKNYNLSNIGEFDIKRSYSELDPYGEEEWSDVNVKPKRYITLKQDIDNENFPYVIEFNTCGFIGGDVPMTFTKFIVFKNVLDGMKDPKCIGFTSDAPYIDNNQADNIIYQPGVWELVPVYQKT